MNVPGFHVDVRRQAATVVVAPRGEIDLAAVGVLRAELDSIASRDVLVLDLRGVSFMDSAGIALVVDEHRRAQHEGFEFRVPARRGHQVRRSFDVTGLSRHLRFTESGAESTAGDQTLA
jgi:anti-sigma B factor antagonist